MNINLNDDNNSQKTLVCKALECYFSNEYIESYLNDDLDLENKKNIQKHLRNCPFCAYDYENILETNEKIKFELAKNDTAAKNIFKAKIIEYTITILVGTLFIASLFYFFVKLNVLAKSEKPKKIQEISKFNEVSFEIR